MNGRAFGPYELDFVRNKISEGAVRPNTLVSFDRAKWVSASDVPELYQPVRSLRTIEFPAGAASAADYKATKFVDDDLHTPLMKKDNQFSTSLSERAATIAQSCLTNANLVDGKLKPFICNDIAVVVFKAFVSASALFGTGRRRFLGGLRLCRCCHLIPLTRNIEASKHRNIETSKIKIT